MSADAPSTSLTRRWVSAGYTCILICAICGGDLSECPHLRDRAYWVRGGPSPSGRCPICLQEECRHSPRRLYRVSLTAIVTKIRGREVSWVRRPANPETRLLSISVSNDDLANHFGEAFTPGVPLSCDKCLGPCWGFSEFEPPVDDGNEPVGAVAGATVTDDGEMLLDLEMP